MKRMYKVIAINGSHRSENGITEIVLKRFIKGAESAKAQCEVLYPSKRKIAPCESCGKCLFETPGVCKYTDDMESIILLLEEADLLVFSSPVYFDSMPSNMKKMIERLRSTLDAYFEFRNGRTYHSKRNKKEQKAITIFTAGNPEKETFVSISRIFYRLIDNMGYRFMGEFCFPASHIFVTQPELVSDQLEALALAGKEIVMKGKISTELLEKANREYVDDPEAFVQSKTRMVLEMRKVNQTNPVWSKNSSASNLTS